MKPALLFVPLSLALSASASQAGCYKNPGRDALVLPTSPFLTQGSCQKLCAEHGLPVAGTNNGAECACNEKLPAKEDAIDMKECNVECPGYFMEKCGGKSPNAWSVSSIQKPSASGSGSSSAASASMTPAPAAISLLKRADHPAYLDSDNSDSDSSSDSSSSDSSSGASSSMEGGILVDSEPTSATAPMQGVGAPVAATPSDSGDSASSTADSGAAAATTSTSEAAAPATTSEAASTKDSDTNAATGAGAKTTSGDDSSAQTTTAPAASASQTGNSNAQTTSMPSTLLTAPSSTSGSSSDSSASPSSSSSSSSDSSDSSDSSSSSSSASASSASASSTGSSAAGRLEGKSSLFGAVLGMGLAYLL